MLSQYSSVHGGQIGALLSIPVSPFVIGFFSLIANICTQHLILASSLDHVIEAVGDRVYVEFMKLLLNPE